MNVLTNKSATEDTEQIGTLSNVGGLNGNNKRQQSNLYEYISIWTCFFLIEYLHHVTQMQVHWTNNSNRRWFQRYIWNAKTMWTWCFPEFYKVNYVRSKIVSFNLFFSEIHSMIISLTWSISVHKQFFMISFRPLLFFSSIKTIFLEKFR